MKRTVVKIMYIIGIIGLAIIGIGLIVGKSVLKKKSSPLWMVGSFFVVFYMYQTSYEQNLFLIGNHLQKENALFLIFLAGIALIFSALFGFEMGSVLLIIVGASTAVGNAIKVASRGEVAQVNDFKTGLVNDVIWNMVLTNFWSYLLIGVLVLVLVALFFLFWKFDQRSPGLYPRALLLVIGSVISIGTFINAEKIADLLKLSTVIVNVEENLNKYGPGGYFLLSNRQDLMVKPPGYSEDSMKEVVNTLQKKYSKKETTTKELPTIIYVLSEAFADPTQFKDTKWKADPMPTVRSYMEKNGGKMLSSVFGGGTSNTEFSILSGFSYDFLKPNSYAYNNLVSNDRELPILTPYEELGYTPIAIHTHLASGYSRDKLFEKFGFEKFITREDLTSNKYYDEGYISDFTFFDTIKGQLQTHKDPLFIHGISMQNHFPYTEEVKGKLKEADNLLENENQISSGKQLSLFARGIKKTDDQVKNFTEYLQTIDKPVYLLFYGDHFPALNNDLYEKVGLKDSFSQQTAKFETPYFIWTNQSATPDKKSSIVNPEFLNELLLEQAGIKETVFQSFIGEVEKNIPAFSIKDDLYFNESGEKKSLNKKDKELLDMYRLIQYDMLSGKQYSKELFQSFK